MKQSNQTLIPEHYRSIDEIVEFWELERPQFAPSDYIFRKLLHALCDGVFFEHGVAFRAYAYMMEMYSQTGEYRPDNPTAIRQPDGSYQTGPPNPVSELEPVKDLDDLIEYFELEAPDGFSLSLIESEETFKNWLKNTKFQSLPVEAQRILSFIAISKPAFQTWCAGEELSFPKFSRMWQGAEKIPKRDPSIFGTKITEREKCQSWLEDLMQNGDQEGLKPDYLEEAQFKFSIAERQFDIAWDNAKAKVGNPSWGKRGRRKKKNN